MFMTGYKQPDFSEIGRKIREYRGDAKIYSLAGESLPTTQENLLEYMRRMGLETVGRNTLSSLENGDERAFSSISMRKLYDLCSVLGCSVGHLLGEYDCRDYDTQYIQNDTGLSERSIVTLRKISCLVQNSNDNTVFLRSMNALNALLETDTGIDLIGLIGDYLYNTHIDGYEEYPDGSKRLLPSEDLNETDLLIKIVPQIKELCEIVALNRTDKQGRENHG